MNWPINTKLILKILFLDHSKNSFEALDSLEIKLTTCESILGLYLWRHPSVSIEAK